jgi:Tfp pilus assembly protein PilV
MNLDKSKRPIRTTNSEKGFTLIETCVSLVVLMIVGVGVAGAFVYAVSSNNGTGDRTAALAIAQRAMEKLRASDFTDSSLNSTAGNTTTQSVSVNNHNYTISTTIADTVVSGKITLKKITVQVSPQNISSLSSLSSGATTSGTFGSVTLVSERAAPTPGTNLQ